VFCVDELKWSGSNEWSIYRLNKPDKLFQWQIAVADLLLWLLLYLTFNQLRAKVLSSKPNARSHANLQSAADVGLSYTDQVAGPTVSQVSYTNSLALNARLDQQLPTRTCKQNLQCSWDTMHASAAFAAKWNLEKSTHKWDYYGVYILIRNPSFVNEIFYDMCVHIIYTVSQRRIPDIINCSLKKDYHILITFGTSPNLCSALPGENRASEIIHFYSKQYDYLVKISDTKHILSRFLSLWLRVYPIVQSSHCL